MEKRKNVKFRKLENENVGFCIDRMERFILKFRKLIN